MTGVTGVCKNNSGPGRATSCLRCGTNGAVLDVRR